ncbi:FMN-binding protein [Cellulophaga fucicola]|uniref:Na+-translocating ferredoxin:NAD+ oxidoreductase RNF, RnfG subunit n=1 Tax=Cellulophaga fucicola TaxID=76595 RepID=A0A1K1N1Q2_9FLAO|nr:FMN-binding protein [Cellulophaga fucicola]SFW29181.1 Na+-translocating ferredoxin:NAD+ oxidoreductase RNF, RnfG subunit [Cellulophaga fucicola]
MKLSRLYTVAILIFSFTLFGFGLSGAIHKKVKKEIVKVFGVEDATLKSVSVSGELNKDLPVKITEDNFYSLLKDNKLVGYVFVDQASSKTAKFDYLVLFNENLEVVSSKVLIYREEYGGEIGSSRWLKQFLGKTGKDRVSLNTNIDAISGATISVRSMTNAMDNLLQTIGMLQERKVL